MLEVYEQITSGWGAGGMDGAVGPPVWNAGGMVSSSLGSPKKKQQPDAEMHTLVGGRTFMVVVRPTLSRDLSPLEAAAAMESHARIETALACEASVPEGRVGLDGRTGSGGQDPGDGLHWAVAGERVEILVRMPPRPLRSPPRKVVRRTAAGDEVMSGPNSVGKGGGRVGSWSAAEHLVLDQAKLAVSGAIVPAPGCEERRTDLSDFELNACRDNGDGSFLVAYTATIAGELHLSIELAGGGHIGGSPFSVEVRPNRLVVGNSTASGDGLHDSNVGVLTHFDVFPRDRCGNARRFEPSEVLARIVRAPSHGGGSGSGRDACRVDFSSGPEGGCRVSYTLLEPGSYLVHVATGHGDEEDGFHEDRFQPVGGSPFELECGAGPIELSCCTMLEVGIGGEPLARTLSVGGGRIWIQTRDQLANARSTPSTQELWCELRVGSADPQTAPTVVQCACVDLGDGRVEVTYPSNAPPGILEVWIGLVGTAEANDPARRLSGGAPPPPSEHRLGLLRMETAIRFADNSLVTAPGVLRVKPGMLFDILVFSTDDAGRQQNKGGEQLRAQLSSGPAPVALEVYDNGDGSYRVATAVQVSGEYKIAFYVNGLPVAGSPILLVAPRTTPGRADSPRGTASGASMRANSPRRVADSPRADSPRGARGAPTPGTRADSPRGGRFDRQVSDNPRGTSRPRSTPLVAPKPGMPPRGPVAAALPSAAATMRGMYDSTNLR